MSTGRISGGASEVTCPGGWVTAGLGLLTVGQAFPEPQGGPGLGSRKVVSALRVLSYFWEDG